MRILLDLLLAGCSTAPNIVQLLPDKEPVCGWTKPWTYCCVANTGPALVVKCAEYEKTDNTAPPIETPKES